MKQALYRTLASLVDARIRCGMCSDGKTPAIQDSAMNNAERYHQHTARLFDLVKEYMPSGSGVDNGTKIRLDKSTPDRLVFDLSFHHLNETGMYAGWTEHVVTVTPSLANRIDIRISGRDRNQIKDYLHGILLGCLLFEV